MSELATLTVGEEVLDLEVTHTRAQIKAYADASGDQNPIHQDDAVARSVGLPGVIAHGMLNYGLLSRAITDWLGDPGRLRRLTVRFSSMVEPGDTVRCRGRVTSIDDSARTAVLEVWMENQRAEKVLSHAEAVITA
ncbi:MAG: MaoC family dehydratase N-terminal domain-containing protein [Candidatus Dormibacteraeota bacterium]|nr:MaoC family dehydratase N-terminal domain-containing protein [Candidatus Dormibacteraeota bacterium]